MALELQEYYDYMSSYGHPGPELMNFLSELPNAMFQDMTSGLYKKNILAVTMFAGTEELFVESLCGRLRMTVFLSGVHLLQLSNARVEGFALLLQLNNTRVEGIALLYCHAQASGTQPVTLTCTW